MFIILGQDNKEKHCSTLESAKSCLVAQQFEARDVVIGFICLHRLAPAYLCRKVIVTADVHSLNTIDTERIKSHAWESFIVL